MQKPETLADITIARRFNGPPTTGNGGYSAGLLAQHMSGLVSVELRAPPPLDVSIAILKTEAGLEARSGDALIMRAYESEPLSLPPAPPTLEAAKTGAAHFPKKDELEFVDCFVCGPARDYPDGLCIFAGPVDGFEGVADVWTPDVGLAADDGLVAPEFIWAALDCPGAYAVGMTEGPVVLARMSVSLIKRPQPGEPLIVTGWKTFEDGRKHGAGTALYTRDGELLAHSEQLWIRLKI